MNRTIKFNSIDVTIDAVIKWDELGAEFAETNSADQAEFLFRAFTAFDLLEGNPQAQVLYIAEDLKKRGAGVKRVVEHLKDLIAYIEGGAN